MARHLAFVLTAALTPWALAYAGTGPDPGGGGVAPCDDLCHLRLDIYLVGSGDCFHFTLPDCLYCPGASAAATYYCTKDGTSSSLYCLTHPSGGRNAVYRYIGCTPICPVGGARGVEANPVDFPTENPIDPPLNTCTSQSPGPPGNE